MFKTNPFTWLVAVLAAMIGQPSGQASSTLRVTPGTEVAVELQGLLDLEPVVVVQTVAGEIPLQLTPGVAPQTVANFLHYVTQGLYVDSFFHRSAVLQNGQPFVIQGGGFFFDFTDEGVFVEPVPEQDPVVNEPNVSNTRGTVAMAKLGGDPDSATSQWFVNLLDNGPILDGQNGGFTVFGTVIGNGMEVVDAIAALPVFDLTETLGLGALADALARVPLAGVDEEQPLRVDNFVIVTDAFIQAPQYTATLAAGQPDDLQLVLEDGVLTLSPAADASGIREVIISGGAPQGEAVQWTLRVELGLDLAAFRQRYFAPDRDLRSGWRTSDRFGDYYAAGFPWLWQPALGWVYVLEDSQNAYWLWDAFTGDWFWVPAGDFPTAYSFTRGAWTHFSLAGEAIAGHRWIYVFGSGWERF